MPNSIAIVAFDTTDGADKTLASLKQLKHEHRITYDEVIIVIKDEMARFPCWIQARFTRQSDGQRLDLGNCRRHDTRWADSWFANRRRRRTLCRQSTLITASAMRKSR